MNSGFRLDEIVRSDALADLREFRKHNPLIQQVIEEPRNRPQMAGRISVKPQTLFLPQTMLTVQLIALQITSLPITIAFTVE
jgi:hypothetical protein